MTYEFHLESPLPLYIKDTLTLIAVDESSEDYVYKIQFTSMAEHDEFCEIVYSILDINGCGVAA